MVRFFLARSFGCGRPGRTAIGNFWNWHSVAAERLEFSSDVVVEAFEIETMAMTVVTP